MRKVHNGRAGFTLIELMIVVAILGVLAALAIPEFMDYLHESKASEATMNLSKLFDGAAAYYTREFTDRGVDFDSSSAPSHHTHCTVASREDGTTPTAEKHAFPNDPAELEEPEFRALKFSLNSPVYYSYEIVNEGGDAACNSGPRNNEVYTFLAKGDLDGDGALAEYELAVGTDEDNNLFHAAGVYRVTEEDVW